MTELHSIWKRPILSFFCALPLIFLTSSLAWGLTETAQKIYKRNSPSVYQIQVIDINSREKFVIGSGFQISKDGLFATNYHVISDTVDKPEQYRIDYYTKGRKVGSLTVEAIDVAHDLAILKSSGAKGNPVRLGKSKQGKGTHIFPMGNPLDVGMVVIEGTYNGLVGDDPYQHILLSASLNPGMSGGPAFDARGRVIGVNVAIEGNDLSYLVPVEYLIRLEKLFRKNGKPTNWVETIQTQILNRFDHMVSKAEKAKWSYENFGSLKVPQKILTPIIKCWGQSRPEDPSKNNFYFYGSKWCESDKNVYLSSQLYTGTIGYTFFWLESKSLGGREFFKQYAREYQDSKFYNNATEEEVTQYRCQNHFVNFANKDWKAAYCVRRYKKYAKLNDVFLSFAILGDSQRKYIIQIGLSGISEPLARRFLKKFLGGIQWTG